MGLTSVGWHVVAAAVLFLSARDGKALAFISFSPSSFREAIYSAKLSTSAGIDGVAPVLLSQTFFFSLLLIF